MAYISIVGGIIVHLLNQGVKLKSYLYLGVHRSTYVHTVQVRICNFMPQTVFQ